MFEISKFIEIDTAHRVPEHGSKCRNLHGHRYRVTVNMRSAELHLSGEQNGMVLDFSFIKELLNEHVDATCDHGLVLSVYDPVFEALTGIDPEDVMRGNMLPSVNGEGNSDTATVGLYDFLSRNGAFNQVDWSRSFNGLAGKVYAVAFTPTAENLAAHFFAKLEQPLRERSNNLAHLKSVLVRETPSCEAYFSRGS